MTAPIKIPFGVADFTIGEGADAIKFDGKTYMQADGGEIKISPILQEIKFADFGESVYDEIVTGYEGELKIIAGQEDIRVLQTALSFTDAIVDTTDGKTVGLMDARIGSSMREKAKKVTIHPRIMGTDKSFDIVLYKMASAGEFARTYGNEQGKQELTLKLYPRDGFDADKPGNFFYIGPVDPNATPEPPTTP